MKDEYDFEFLMRNMTDAQKSLFLENLDLWEKTAQMNNRPQHFDGFDVDLQMLLQEWKYLLENILNLEFSEKVSLRAKQDIGDD